MFVFALTGLVSVVLFAVAIALIIRASAVPPSVIRTTSRRSQEEYAYHRHQAAIRRGAYMVAMAAAMTLVIFVTTGLAQFAGH